MPKATGGLRERRVAGGEPGWHNAAMRRVAAALEAVRSTRSKKEKVAHLAALLSSLDATELPLAARLVLGAIRTTGAGWALLVAAAAEVTRRSEEEIGLKTREVGDLGDALGALHPPDAPSLPLAEVPALVDRLAAATERDEKHRVLVDLLGRATPQEVRYLAKALLGELRVGLARGLFEEALALAFGAPLEDVRRASAMTPDPGELALLARAGRLREATLVPGRPVAFMLATPVDEVKEPIDAALTLVEDKLDGVRVQAHVLEGQVRLFARGLDEVTATFPEVARALAGVRGTVVLDGEIVAVTAEGRSRPFQALQARLGRSAVSASVRADVPVRFVAYDLLFDGEPLVDRPWRERRARLERLGVDTNPVVALDPSHPLEPQLDELFTRARARANEGLMLKRADAPYEAGRRGAAWRKVKRAWATLDVVVTRAERGHGRRVGVLSDYTFAVWRGDRLVEIGKAYSGLTDAELAALTRRLEALTVRHEGPYAVVRPELVLEVAFDGIQRSTRHDGGYALRFPRIARIRDDKGPADADRLETVRALYEAQLRSGHREDARQLDLFD